MSYPVRILTGYDLLLDTTFISMAKRDKIPHGLDIRGNEVKAHAPGSLYQVSPGDPTNEQFTEVIRNGAEKLAKENPHFASEDEEDDDEDDS